METKKTILILIALSVIISGCLNSEDEGENGKEEREASGSSGGSQRQREVRTPEGMQEEMWTSEKTETEEEMWTPKETEAMEEATAQEELEASVETGTQVELDTPEETKTSNVPDEPEMEQTEVRKWEQERTGAIQPGGTPPTSHFVRLKNYLMIPSSLEINAGDTVIWKNYQESSVLTLTSREHLFEDRKLAYGSTLEYTFNEPGSYSFSVKGYPKMQATITVK
ncbi:MAG TPA: cell surface lipoprotein [Methanosarcina sp.]|nr:cell surface lipoprotein [Methanosarcina sp.]